MAPRQTGQPPVPSCLPIHFPAGDTRPAQPPGPPQCSNAYRAGTRPTGRKRCAGGANLPRQADVFPDRDHFGRIFFNQVGSGQFQWPFSVFTEGWGPIQRGWAGSGPSMTARVEPLVLHTAAVPGCMADQPALTLSRAIQQLHL